MEQHTGQAAPNPPTQGQEAVQSQDNAPLPANIQVQSQAIAVAELPQQNGAQLAETDQDDDDSDSDSGSDSGSSYYSDGELARVEAFVHSQVPPTIPPGGPNLGPGEWQPVWEQARVGGQLFMSCYANNLEQFGAAAAQLHTVLEASGRDYITVYIYMNGELQDRYRIYNHHELGDVYGDGQPTLFNTTQQVPHQNQQTQTAPVQIEEADENQSDPPQQSGDDQHD